jgi:hypothetical protein
MSLIGPCLSVSQLRLCFWDLCGPVIITSFYHAMNLYFCSAHALLSVCQQPMTLKATCPMQESVREVHAV